MQHQKKNEEKFKKSTLKYVVTKFKLVKKVKGNNKNQYRTRWKDIKQYEEYNRKDNNSGVSRNKSNEHETNIHKKLKEQYKERITSVKPEKRAVTKMEKVQTKENHTK